jgi:methionyl-tRNA formyltransferase
MAIVFFGTPAFAVPSLRRLVDDRFEIAAVYTQPDRPAGRGRHTAPPPIKTVALQLGLPVRQPESLRDPAALAELAALAPEAGVGVAYGQILRRELLDIPTRGVLNVHPSLLPRHRGASPVPAAILAGDRETGVSVILMDAGMDSGPLLAQRAVPIADADTTGSLTEALAGVAADLLAETLPRWLRGEIEARPQDESLATRAPLLKKEHGEIDWSLPAADLWRRVRAYNPWPGAYTKLDGALLHIWEAWPLFPDGGPPGPGAAGAPGAIVALSEEQGDALPPGVDRQAFGVATGAGVLAVLVAQRQGKRPLPAGEFLRGMRDFIGRRLGH